MKKVILFLILITLYGCAEYTTVDITIKNNSDISIYIAGAVVDRNDTYSSYTDMYYRFPQDRVAIEAGGIAVRSIKGLDIYVNRHRPPIDSVCIHFLNAIEYDKVDIPDDYTDKRYYLGYKTYSVGELESSNWTITYPFSESSKVDFRFL